MKEFNGTKGKWQFDAINMKIIGTGDIEGRTVIANVSPKMDYSRGMTTQCANAQLIAAAPGLLKALQELVLQVKTYSKGYSDTTEYFKSEIEQAEKAINKALGK